MKILYVGPLDPGGTCNARLDGLRKLGLEVEPFDRLQHVRWGGRSRLAKLWEWGTFTGPVLREANRTLSERAEEVRPDLIWVDKGDWIFGRTLQRMRRLGAVLCHHNTDSMRPRNWQLRYARRLLRQTIGFFDFHLTTNDADYVALTNSRPGAVIKTQLGYDERRFGGGRLTPAEAARWQSGLVFVGHYEQHTESGVLALHRAGLPVRVYGSSVRWSGSRASRELGANLRPALSDAEYVSALKGATIGLCFFSRLNGNQDAGRSYEIPACGTFLLGMRSAIHCERYREGSEAEFFDSETELIAKARQYLEDDARRRVLAAAGHARCLTSGYSWQAIMGRDWAELHRRIERDRSPGGMRRGGSG